MTEPVKPFLDVVLVSSQLHVYVSQTDRGEFLIGAEIEPYTTYKSTGTLSFLEYSAGHAIELLPQLERTKVLRTWTGLCDLSPDYSPILGKTEIDNFHVSTGWGTYGFKAAPIVGVTLAELVATRQDARPHRAVRDGALPHRHPRLRAGRRCGESLNLAGRWPTVMPSSLEIAQAATLRPILDVADELGLEHDEVEPYGRYKAKVDLSVIDRLADRPDAKLINVTAITPTPAGEGKTTTSVSLTQGLGVLGRKPVLCLREASLGPVFGVKGGAAGGGYAQVVPMEDLNLHFTGDLHAITRREQPARRADRRAPPPRERRRARSALDLLAPLHGHERPEPPERHHRPRRTRARRAARDRASTSPRRARSWGSSPSPATSPTCASGSAGSPSARRTRASR